MSDRFIAALSGSLWFYADDRAIEATPLAALFIANILGTEWEPADDVADRRIEAVLRKQHGDMIEGTPDE